MSVGDWSTNPDSNTLVGSVFIGENCPSKNLNNAIRQVMAELRVKFDQLDTATAILAGLSSDSIAFLNADNNGQMRNLIGAASAADLSSGTNGNGSWERKPDGNGGFIIRQWGQRQAGTDTWSGDYPFPIAFPNGAEAINVTAINMNFGSLNGNAVSARTSPTTPRTAFQIGSSDNPYVCYWEAVGR